jgi:hypothetical protein
VELTITALQALTVISAHGDCECVSIDSAFPLELAAGAALDLDMSIAGVSPGIKTITVRTTDGDISASVQVVTDGLGQGRDVLERALARCAKNGWSVTFLVHDLRGQLRNCGCSGGALGGIDHLAALPALCAQLRATVAARFVLSGDVEGRSEGVEKALIRCGWTRDDRAFVTAEDIAPLLDDERVLAAIAAHPTDLRHRKIVRPLLTGGMTAQLLFFDHAHVLREQLTLPIDATLASEPSILAEFPQVLTPALIRENSSARCADCHQAAAAVWSASKHAHAFASLKSADHVDACVGCHSTPRSAAQIAEDVHCQSCHLGADAHALDPGHVRAGRALDCRACHDARHHPSFQRAEAWLKIAH